MNPDQIAERWAGDLYLLCAVNVAEKREAYLADFMQSFKSAINEATEGLQKELAEANKSILHLEGMNNPDDPCEVHITFGNKPTGICTTYEAYDEAQKDKVRLDWLANKQDTLSWDDSDFWTVWDGSKAITGSTIREAIDHAIETERMKG